MSKNTNNLYWFAFLSWYSTTMNGAQNPEARKAIAVTANLHLLWTLNGSRALAHPSWMKPLGVCPTNFAGAWEHPRTARANGTTAFVSILKMDRLIKQRQRHRQTKSTKCEASESTKSEQKKRRWQLYRSHK